MPKIRLTDSATGEVAVVDWTSPEPPSSEEARSIINNQIQSRITAKEKIKTDWESIPFQQRAIAASEEPIRKLVSAPSAENIGGLAVKGARTVGSMFNVVPPAQEFAHGFRTIGRPSPELLASPAPLREKIMPMVQEQAGALADIGGGLMGMAAPFFFGAAPIKFARAAAPFMAAGFGARKLQEASGIEAIQPETGIGRLTELGAGFAGAHVAGQLRPLFQRAKPKPSVSTPPPQAAQSAPRGVAPVAAPAKPTEQVLTPTVAAVGRRGRKPVPMADIYAVAREQNLTTDTVNRHIKAVYGKDTTKDLTPDETRALVKDIRAGKVKSLVVTPTPEVAPVVSPGTAKQPSGTPIAQPPAPVVATATPEVPKVGVAEQALASLKKPEVPKVAVETPKPQVAEVRSLSEQLKERQTELAEGEKPVETKPKTIAEQALASLKGPKAPEGPIAPTPTGPVAPEYKVGDKVSAKAGDYEVTAIVPGGVRVALTSRSGKTTSKSMSPWEFQQLQEKAATPVAATTQQPVIEKPTTIRAKATAAGKKVMEDIEAERKVRPPVVGSISARIADFQRKTVELRDKGDMRGMEDAAHEVQRLTKLRERGLTAEKVEGATEVKGPVKRPVKAPTKAGEKGALTVEKPGEKLRRMWNRTGFWVDNRGGVRSTGDMEHGTYIARQAGVGATRAQTAAIGAGWARVRANGVEIRDFTPGITLDTAVSKAVELARNLGDNYINVNAGERTVEIPLNAVPEFLENPRRFARITERGSFPLERGEREKFVRAFTEQGFWVDNKGKITAVPPGKTHQRVEGSANLLKEGHIRIRMNTLEVDSHTPLDKYGTRLDIAVQKAADLARSEGSNLLYLDDGKPKLLKIPLDDVGEFLSNPLSYAHRGERGSWKGLLDFFRRKKDVPGAERTGGPTESDPVKIALEAFRSARPIREAQEAIYSTERGKRFARARSVMKRGAGGEETAKRALGKLKGELPKVTYESLKGKVKQEHIDSIFKMVTKNNTLTEGEKASGITGLLKIFGERGVEVPQRGELAILERAFSAEPSGRVRLARTIAEFGPSERPSSKAAREKIAKEFVDELLSSRDAWIKAKETGLEIANVPRALMASFDLSAPLRQGLFLVGRPKQFIPAFGEMVKAFGSERVYRANQDAIRADSNYDLMERSKLALTEIGGELSKREELFMSDLASKIPIIGHGVRASNRAYVTFLNKLRADVFSDLVNKAEKAKLNPVENVKLTNALADYINSATGRGKLAEGLEASAPVLNAVFFSPRLMSSRLKLMNPAYYIKQPSFVRKQMLRDLFSSTAFVTTLVGLAHLAGAETEGDPRSADFGKIKVGNTRLDFGGGFLQYIRLAAQLISNSVKRGGRVTELGEGYKPDTRLSVLGRFFESKENPVVSFASDLLRGRTMSGEPVNVPREIGSRFVPMVVQDFYDVIKDDPELLPLAIPGIFGAGVQTYQSRRRVGPPSRIRRPSISVSRRVARPR